MQSEARVELARLAAELQRRGWQTELRSDGRLVVRNPDDDELRDHIGCREGVDGREYVWSWGDVIGAAGDVAVASDRIVRVLRSVGANGPVSE
jgi:hypothetical protein